MKMIRAAALAAVLVAGAASAQAGEMRLSDEQLDNVAAGFFELPEVSLGGLLGLLGALPVELPSLELPTNGVPVNNGFDPSSILSLLQGLIGGGLPNGVEPL